MPSRLTLRERVGPREGEPARVASAASALPAIATTAATAAATTTAAAAATTTAVAATTAATTTATAATAAKSAATAAAATTATTILGLLHGHRATLQVAAVELLDRLAGLVFGRHLDEAEAARPAGVTVGDDLGLGDGAHAANRSRSSSSVTL